MSDHDPYSDSHSGGPAGGLLAPSENWGLGTCLVWKSSNEREGHLHFHGFFAFAYLWSGIFDFNSISTRNHRAVAKRSDAVLPGMARSYSTPVRRISRSFSSDAKLARLGLEFYQGGLEICSARARILQVMRASEIAEITLKNRLHRAAFGGSGHTATRREAD